MTTNLDTDVCLSDYIQGLDTHLFNRVLISITFRFEGLLKFVLKPCDIKAFRSYLVIMMAL